MRFITPLSSRHDRVPTPKSLCRQSPKFGNHLWIKELTTGLRVDESRESQRDPVGSPPLMVYPEGRASGRTQIVISLTSTTTTTHEPVPSPSVARDTKTPEIKIVFKLRKLFQLLLNEWNMWAAYQATIEAQWFHQFSPCTMSLFLTL